MVSWRAALILATAGLVACRQPTVNDTAPWDTATYCGEPEVTVASWDDGPDHSAQSVHDGLLGLWQGTVSLGASEEAMTLVVNDATAPPEYVTYPHEGEAYDFDVADACLETWRFAMPAQLGLDERGFAMHFDLELSGNVFMSDWLCDQETDNPDCSGDVCSLELRFVREPPDSDELVGKLEVVTAEGGATNPATEDNFLLARVTE